MKSFVFISWFSGIGWAKKFIWVSPCCCRQVTSVVSDSVWPHRRQPTRLPHPWGSPGRTLEWVAISFSNAWKWKVKVKSLSHVRLSVIPWTAAYQAPPSMEFSRQENWSGVPSPSPGFLHKMLQKARTDFWANPYLKRVMPSMPYLNPLTFQII